MQRKTVTPTTTRKLKRKTKPPLPVVKRVQRGATNVSFLSQISPSPRNAKAYRHAIDYLDRYSGNTRKLYDRHFGRYWTWCDNRQLRIWDVTRTDIETYTRSLITDGLKPSSIRSTLTPVHNYYRLVHADGHIDRNPAIMAWKPKVEVDREQLKWLDRHELARWIKASESVSPRHWAAAVLLGILGLRASELASLRVENIAESKNGYRVIRFTGKNGKKAIMPLTVPMIRALDAVIDDRKEGPLIPALSGEHLTRFGVSNLVQTICRHADLPMMGAHAIRRSCITAALDMGTPMRDAQALARHADPSTTMLYDRNSFSLDRSAVHSLSSWLAG